MIKQIEDWKMVNSKLSKEQYEQLHIYNCDNDDTRDDFIEKITEVNIKNKEKLRNLLGGNKIYTTIQCENQTIDFSRCSSVLNEYIKYMSKRYDLGRSWWTLENNKLYKAKDELSRFFNLIYCANDYNCVNNDEIIEILKEEYFYNENIQKLRDLPKLTRLFRMIYDGVIDRYKLSNDYEPMVAKIMDELGRKPTKYIMEISTDALDILTCSVSHNFTSCFNISSGGCNHASTNLMAIDETTAVLKLYKLNDTNKELMEKGKLNYIDAVARAFVSFDVDNNKRMVIGRLYPDDKILNYDNLKEILFPLLKCEDTSKGQWVKDMIIDYGDNYVGYKDYNQSWNWGYLANTKCKRLHVGDKGCVFYNIFTDRFEVSDTYRLKTGRMWELTYEETMRLERDMTIKPYVEDNEESESSIVDTTNSIATMVDRRFIDDTPFYEIRDVNSTFSISTRASDYIISNGDYITGINAEPPYDQEIADRLNRIQIQADNIYGWVPQSTTNNND